MDGDSAGNAEDDGFVFLLHCAISVCLGGTESPCESSRRPAQNYPYYCKVLIESKRL